MPSTTPSPPATTVGPLAGLVTAHKDLEETADFPTTYGSPLFAGHRPAADCLLVARMKAAGAVAVGKTNTPEFGAGSHTFNRVYGVTQNPWGLGRTAGGSSGGAAVALTCRMVATADGSDTGGSLRNPAAWNNVVGFRPTVRVVPHVGPGNAWMPISTRGPMGRTVDDVALLLDVLAAPDDRDPMHRPFRIPAPGARRRTGRCAWRGRPTSACPSSGRSSTCSPARARRCSTSAGTSSTTSPSSPWPATASACCGRGTSPTARRPASTTAWTRSRRRSRTRSPAARR